MSYTSYQRPNWHMQGLLHSFQSAVDKAQEWKMSQSTKAGVSSTRDIDLHSSSHGSSVPLSLLCATGPGQSEVSVHYWSLWHCWHCWTASQGRACGWREDLVPFLDRITWPTHSAALPQAAVSVCAWCQIPHEQNYAWPSIWPEALTVHPCYQVWWFYPVRKSLGCCSSRVNALLILVLILNQTPYPYSSIISIQAEECKWECTRISSCWALDSHLD